MSVALQFRSGFWRRFGGALIDGLVIGVVRIILALILGSNAAGGLALIGSAAYFTYFHGSTGQTPGDAALSIRIVDLNGGGSIGYGRAFIRWLVSLVSALVFLLGYLWMLWDRPERQTWHDKAANSVVVPTGS